MLAACAAPPAGLIMPPPEYDHPFVGNRYDHVLPPGVKEMEVRSDPLMDGFTGRTPQCDIWLPRVGDPGPPPVDAQRRADLEKIARANCNGWAARDGDVNAQGW